MVGDQGGAGHEKGHVGTALGGSLGVITFNDVYPSPPDALLTAWGSPSKSLWGGVASSGLVSLSRLIVVVAIERLS